MTGASLRFCSESPALYHETESRYRKWCTACGGHLLTELPGTGLTDVYAAIIPDFPFTPAVPMNQRETCLRMTGGLPKLRDFPQEIGGSAERLPE